jgi:23S rRNA (guanosine2251-2'-O)-methyltransferase
MRDKPRHLGTEKNTRAPMRTPGGTEIIYGRNAVLETIRTGSRTIHEILVLPQHEAEILDTAGPVAIRVLQRQDMERIAGTDHHQGMAARVSAYRYAGLDDLLGYRVVVLLDSVEDPQNLGSIVRTAHALAGAGMVIPEHRAAGVTPAVVKASSGATEHVKIARVTNLRTAAQKLKENGFWLVGLEADARDDIGSIPRFDKVGLVLGGEDSGIRPVVTSELDMAARIPMQGAFNSLNVAHAAAIALYELAVRGR